VAFYLTTPGQRNLNVATDGGPVELIAIPAPGASSPPASLQGTILLDPQNTTGVANDTNPPTITAQGFTGPVFKSWAGLVAQWGTYGPSLATFGCVFLSSHVDNSDPVVFRPLATTAGPLSIQGGAPTLVAQVSLSGVTPKSRAAGANSLLIATLGGLAQPGMLLENLSHPSRAWVYKSLGAGSFSITQPMAKQAIGGTSQPAEVDTWANGDLVNILLPVSVNIVDVEGILSKGLTGGIITLFQLTVLAPSGTGLDWIQLGGPNVQIQECNIGRFVTMPDPCTFLALGNTVIAGGAEIAGITQISGGASLGSALGVNIVAGQNTVTIDGDFILGLSAGNCFWGSSGEIQLGFIFLDANVQVLTGNVIATNLSYGGHVIYGSGANTLDMKAQSHFGLASGTFVAGFTAPGLVTGIKLNGSATGSSITGAGAINQGIATTPANLDAAAGAAGFGGRAFNFGGAACTNFI
jgi:hypothetical protein